MANLNTTFFGSQDGVVDGNDSRTQGDENLNALADSLKLQCPNWNTPISKTANEVNDCTEASASETISGAWNFTGVLDLDASPSALTLTLASTDQQIRKQNGGDLLISTSQTGSDVAIRPADQTAISCSNTLVTVVTAAQFNNPVTIAGLLTVADVTAGGFVQTDELRTANVGPATVNTITGYMPLYSTSGTVIGYLPVYNFV